MVWVTELKCSPDFGSLSVCGCLKLSYDFIQLSPSFKVFRLSKLLQCSKILATNFIFFGLCFLYAKNSTSFVSNFCILYFHVINSSHCFFTFSYVQ